MQKKRADQKACQWKWDGLCCGSLIGVFVVIFVLIRVLHPGTVYGSSGDWLNQHFAIPDYFRMQFYETGNLFPNFAGQIGGGQNIYYFAYYGLLSPIILCSYLLPWVPMITYLQWVSILSVLSATILCYFFMKKWYSVPFSFLLALLFLLAAPIIFHSHHHIMFINYFPFLFWALFSVHRCIQKGSSIQLVVAACCILLCSFYFSIGAFLAIWVYGMYVVCTQKKELAMPHVYWRMSLRIGIHLLLAVLLAGVLLLPTAATLLHGRDATHAAVDWFTLLFPIPNVHYFVYSPFSIGGTFFSVFSIFILLDAKRHEIRFLSITFLILLCVPFVLYLMNGTMYLDAKAYIPFLPLVLLLMGAVLRAVLQGEVSKRRCLVCVLLLIGIGVFYNKRTNADFSNSAQIGFLNDGAVCLIAFLLFFRWKKSALLMVPLVVLSGLDCVGINLKETYALKSDLDMIYSADRLQLITETLEEDPAFYRFANEANAGLTVNQVYQPEYYQSTIYSSVHNTRLSSFYFDEIYNENGIRNATMNTQSKNVFCQMLMGCKYLISIEPIERAGYTLVKHYGSYFLYRLEETFPVAYASSQVLAESDFQSLVYPYKAEAILDHIIVPNEYASEACDRSKENASIASYDLQLDDALLKNEAIRPVGASAYRVHSTKDFTVHIPLEQPITDQALLLRFPVKNEYTGKAVGIKGDVVITINGIRNKLTNPNWKYQNHNNIFEYTLTSKEPITELEITFSKGDYQIGEPNCYTLEASTVTDAVQQVDALQIDRKTAAEENTLTGTIQVQKDGWFTASIPYDEGLQIEVDGVQTAYERTNVSFIGFPISAGEHTVTITYHAPWFRAGVCCSLLGILMSIGYFFIQKMRYKKHIHMETPPILEEVPEAIPQKETVSVAE